MKKTVEKDMTFKAVVKMFDLLKKQGYKVEDIMQMKIDNDLIKFKYDKNTNIITIEQTKKLKKIILKMIKTLKKLNKSFEKLDKLGIDASYEISIGDIVNKEQI